MDFPGLMPGLQAGKIDAAWTVLNDLTEREQMLDFVDYMKTSSSILVADGNPDDLTGIDDSLCGKSIGTLRGSLYLPLLDTQSAECEADGAPLRVDLFDDSTSAQVQVRSGKSSGFVGLATVIRYSASTVDGGKTFDAVEANILPGYIGIALPKDSELTAAIQSALVKVVESGNYDSVLESFDASSEALTADEIVVNGVGTGQLK
jgi:polar amino acid transport system substrate-binding protein